MSYQLAALPRCSFPRQETLGRAGTELQVKSHPPQKRNERYDTIFWLGNFRTQWCVFLLFPLGFSHLHFRKLTLSLASTDWRILPERKEFAWLNVTLGLSYPHCSQKLIFLLLVPESSSFWTFGKISQLLIPSAPLWAPEPWKSYAFLLGKWPFLQFGYF